MKARHRKFSAIPQLRHRQPCPQRANSYTGPTVVNAGGLALGALVDRHTARYPAQSRVPSWMSLLSPPESPSPRPDTKFQRIGLGNLTVGSGSHHAPAAASLPVRLPSLPAAEVDPATRNVKGTISFPQQTWTLAGGISQGHGASFEYQ